MNATTQSILQTARSISQSDQEANPVMVWMDPEDPDSQTAFRFDADSVPALWSVPLYAKAPEPKDCRLCQHFEGTSTRGRTGCQALFAYGRECMQGSEFKPVHFSPLWKHAVSA